MILYERLTGVRPFDGPDADIIEPMRIGRVCDPRERVPTLPAEVAQAVVRATSPDRADRFATARDLGEALLRCLAALGSAGKERAVTASLAALIDEPPEPLPVVIPPEVSGGSAGRTTESSTTGEVALCEVEIIEASGPIVVRPEPPALPTIPALAEAAGLSPPPAPRPPELSGPTWNMRDPRVFGGPPSVPGVVGWRRTPETPPPEVQQAPVQKAVELFDKGIELRVAGRYGEALQAWERALALAPENQVYRANVARLREQLNELRRAQRRIEDWRET